MARLTLPLQALKHFASLIILFTVILLTDSIITSLLKGGIILNPANQKYAGGGVYSDHPHNAMEENLCRQSDLITSILKFIDIKFPNGYNERKKLMFLGQSGKKTYGNVQKCLVSENTFKYIKEGNNFKELEHPQKRIVLSIASPNMKKFKTTDLDKFEVLNKYKTDMESYWKLAIAAEFGGGNFPFRIGYSYGGNNYMSIGMGFGIYIPTNKGKFAFDLGLGYKGSYNFNSANGFNFGFGWSWLGI
mgnify:CR=1 FL=1